jgi:hypothetical protein
MESEGSLPCYNEPTTGPYSEPDESNPHPLNLFPLTLVLILSSHLRPRLTAVSPLQFSDQNFVCISHISHNGNMFQLVTPLILGTIVKYW